MRRTALVIVLVLSSFSFVAADIIYLRNGRRVEGVIVNQNRKVVRIRVDGRVRTIAKAKIRRVKYGKVKDPAEARREAARRRAEARRKQEEERKRQEAEALRKKEAEARRKQEEERTRQEAERRRRADQEQRRADSGRAAFEKRGGSDVGALWRSSVLPGWGMLYKERTIWGYSYAGLFLAGLGGGAAAAARVSSTKADYDSSTLTTTALGVSTNSAAFTLLSYSLDTASRQEYESSLQSYRGAVGAVALIYLVQLAHAYFASPDSPASSAAHVPPAFGFAIGPEFGRGSMAPSWGTGPTGQTAEAGRSVSLWYTLRL